MEEVNPKYIVNMPGGPGDTKHLQGDLFIKLLGRKKEESTQNTLLIIGSIFFILGLLFWAKGVVTGNAIIFHPYTSGNILGGFLLIFSFVGFSTYVSERQKK